MIQSISRSTTDSAFGFLAIRATASPRAAVPTPPDPERVRQLASELAKLRVALERLGASSIVARTPRAAARVISSTSLGLDLEATATTLRSTAEINAAPTSYAPFGPSFAGLSTSLPTLTGTYSGANGNDTLTFSVNAGGVVGNPGPRRIDVFDGQGHRIDRLNFGGHPPETPLALSNGLRLSVSAGTLVTGNTFQLSVSATVGSSVDPTKPFNGTRNDRPNFEDGVAVAGGSFLVNGIPISVAANDSINTVLGKITSSAAGVTATFDATAERIVLTQKTSGSAPPITLAGDSSGFLAATKLAGALPVVGQDDESAVPVTAVSGLAGIDSGSFTINGVSIPVDPGVDSLDDLLERINASSAGVRAALSPDGARVSIRASSSAKPLVLSDGTSSFFSALAITPGTYEPSRVGSGRSGRGFEDARKVKAELREVGHQLDGLFQYTDVGPAVVELVRGELRAAIAAAFDPIVGREQRLLLSSGLGIDFDFREGRPHVLELDTRRFDRSQDSRFDVLEDFLFREASATEPGGLVVSLGDALARIEQELAATAALERMQGRLVDVVA